MHQQTLLPHTGPSIAAKSEIFVHSGSDNRISNNIFVASNNATKRGAIWVNNAIRGCEAARNDFTRNVVYGLGTKYG